MVQGLLFNYNKKKLFSITRDYFHITSAYVIGYVVKCVCVYPGRIDEGFDWEGGRERYSVTAVLSM